MIINPTQQQINPPSIATLLDAKRTEIAKAINCVRVGVIKEFNASEQTANVEIAQQQVTSVSPDGTRTLNEFPVLIRIPVFVLFGGNDFLSMPIAAGDNCIVLFNDRELDNWHINGPGNAPTTARLHDLSDGIAIVGIRPLTDTIANYLANGIRLAHASGGNLCQMDFTDALLAITVARMTVSGNAEIGGDLAVDGNLSVAGHSGAGSVTLGADLIQTTGKVLKAGNGVTGTFNIVTVQNGIVTGGS